jgi:hypothetical protein
MNLKTSVEENNFVEKISANCAVDSKVVREVLKGILKTFTIEFYGDNYEIYIPYICKIVISYYEKISDEGIKFNVDLDATPCDSLLRELKEINEGNITDTENYIRNQIFSELIKKVEA